MGDDRECLQIDLLFTVGCPLVGRGGVCLLVGSWYRSSGHFLLLPPRLRLYLGQLADCFHSGI